MKDHTTSKPEGARRPHTVYVTDELWALLERHHLELRLATTAASPSKIDFVEQVIRVGLEAMGSPSVGQQVPRPRSSQSASRHKEEVPDTSPPLVPPSVPRPEESPSAEAARTPKPASEKISRHRLSAMERLMQASDPGRPAPIPSAAREPQRSKGEK